MNAPALAELPAFPCSAGDKKPLTVHGFHDARRGLDQSRWPLVGVPTGIEFDILDIDPRNGGADWYDQHFTALPLTRCHATRSGGVHLLFKPAPGLRCSSGRIAAGVDVRAGGGYAIWWPREGLPVEGAPLCEWPDWLLELALRRQSGLSMQSEGACKSASPDGASPHVVAPTQRPGLGEPTHSNVGYRLTALVRQVQNAPKGKRNDVLYWATCRMAEMVGRGEVKIKITRQLLEAACQTNGLWRDPDDGPDRCRATIASAFSEIEGRMLADGQGHRGGTEYTCSL